MPTAKDKNVRTISPRVDGKRPRIKPRALDVDEHVRRGGEPLTSAPVDADQKDTNAAPTSPTLNKEA